METPSLANFFVRSIPVNIDQDLKNGLFFMCPVLDRENREMSFHRFPEKKPVANSRGASGLPKRPLRPAAIHNRLFSRTDP